MSGDYYTDLIAVPQNWLGSFAMSGLLLNLRLASVHKLQCAYFDWTCNGADNHSVQRLGRVRRSQ